MMREKLQVVIYEQWRGDETQSAEIKWIETLAWKNFHEGLDDLWQRLQQIAVNSGSDALVLITDGEALAVEDFTTALNESSIPLYHLGVREIGHGSPPIMSVSNPVLNRFDIRRDDREAEVALSLENPISNLVLALSSQFEAMPIILWVQSYHPLDSEPVVFDDLTSYDDHALAA